MSQKIPEVNPPMKSEKQIQLFEGKPIQEKWLV